MRIIAVTNRALCPDGNKGLIKQIETLCQAGFDYVILREKDLDLSRYTTLVCELLITLPNTYWHTILLHSHTPAEITEELSRNSAYTSASPEQQVQIRAGIAQLAGCHLTADYLSRSDFDVLAPSQALPSFWGTSVHNLKELKRACQKGAAYIIAGHIFSTACKPDLPARGLVFLDTLQEVLSSQDTQTSTHPELWAIGGINAQNVRSVFDHASQGVCLMSSAMQQDPFHLMGQLRAALRQQRAYPLAPSPAYLS